MKNFLYATLFVLSLSACQKEESASTGTVTSTGKKDTTTTTTPVVVSNVPIFRPADTTQGAITALKQGKVWKAGGYAVLQGFKGHSEKVWSIGFGTVTNDGKIRRESFLCRVPLDGLYKKLPLHPVLRLSRRDTAHCFYGRLYEDGDVFGDSYDIDTIATDNFLYITKCDTVNKRMEGIFNASFRLAMPPATDPTNPLVLKFTQGKFWAVIRN